MNILEVMILKGRQQAEASRAADQSGIRLRRTLDQWLFDFPAYCPADADYARLVDNYVRQGMPIQDAHARARQDLTPVWRQNRAAEIMRRRKVWLIAFAIAAALGVMMLFGSWAGAQDSRKNQQWQSCLARHTVYDQYGDVDYAASNKAGWAACGMTP